MTQHRLLGRMERMCGRILWNLTLTDKNSPVRPARARQEQRDQSRWVQLKHAATFLPSAKDFFPLQDLHSTLLSLDRLMYYVLWLLDNVSECEF